jgi:hypothetical protein
MSTIADARLSCCTAAPEEQSALGKRLADVTGHRCPSPLLLPVSQRLVHKSVHKTDRPVPLATLLAYVFLFVLIGGSREDHRNPSRGHGLDAAGRVALAWRRSRPLHDPPGQVGSLADGQEGPETSWGDLVTDEEYNA